MKSLSEEHPRRRLDTQLLLRAYGAGLFPMGDTREAEEIFWVEPRRRGILPLHSFHLSRSLARTLKQQRFVHTRDLAFEAVILSCAARGKGREESWINPTIVDAYHRLHEEGQAHSIETWDRETGKLVGGLYGVRLGAAFFGESMFSRATDASKAALAHLVARLRVGGFRLLDTQFLTDHLARFGGVEVRRGQYLDLLREARETTGDWFLLDRMAPVEGHYFGVPPVVSVAPRVELGEPAEAVLDPMSFSGALSGKFIAQLLSQTS